MGLPTPYSFTDPLNPTPNPALESDEARVAFWEKQAQRLTWAEPWHTAHRFEKPKSLGFDEDGIEQFSIPEIKWFEGGKLNVAYNCVDRHVEAGRGDKVALYFEGEPGDREAITYSELQRRIAKAANGLRPWACARVTVWSSTCPSSPKPLFSPSPARVLARSTPSSSVVSPLRR